MKDASSGTKGSSSHRAGSTANKNQENTQEKHKARIHCYHASKVTAVNGFSTTPGVMRTTRNRKVMKLIP